MKMLVIKSVILAVQCHVFCFLQELELTWHKDLRPKKRTVCFDVSTSVRKAPVILFNCHGMRGNQRFKYNLVSIIL